MSLRNISVVCAKELRDLLRDKRTILSMIVVPVFVMPALMIGFGTVSAKLVKSARQEVPKVMVLGGEDSPRTLTALHTLETVEFVPPSPNYTNLISDKKIRAAVEIPDGFDAALESGEAKNVRIFIYQGELRSSFGAQPIQQFFQELRENTVSERLAARDFPEEWLKPFEIRQTNVAPPKKVGGNLVGAIIPYILILMCMTGAMYPAIDVTAGEKERGTMETLLCSPVARMHLVIGKCLMVLAASLVTILLSLSSMGISFWLLKSQAAGFGKSGMLAALTVDPGSLAAVFAMMFPTAIFFSATMLAIGLFSRNPKEAHSYLQPLLIVAIMPALASALPGVELNSSLALVPVVNVSLVSKEILSGTYHWNYIALIFGSTCVYAALAFAAALAMFKRESVLFRT